MVRSPRKENQTVLRKGAWDPEEDRKLIAYIHRYGIWNWSQMPKFAGLLRSGKSCRLRWLNYLSPDVKRGNFTEKEVEIIISMYQKFGSRWSSIAKELPGRTDNEIKNYWHTHLKKLFSVSKNNLVLSVHEDDDDNESDPELAPIQENPHEEIIPSVLHYPQVSTLEGYNYQQVADDTSSSGSDDADDQVRRQLETAFAEMNISGDPHNSHEIHNNNNNNNNTSSWTQEFTLENLCMVLPSRSLLVDPLYPIFCFYNDLYCDILFNFPDQRGTADFEEPFFSF